MKRATLISFVASIFLLTQVFAVSAQSTTPSPSPTGQTSPTTTPATTLTTTPGATVSATPTRRPSPRASATLTPSLTPTNTPTLTPSPTPTATPQPPFFGAVTGTPLTLILIVSGILLAGVAILLRKKGNQSTDQLRNR